MAGSINCLSEIIKYQSKARNLFNVREYGIEKAAVKIIVGIIPNIFQHADKNVRMEGTNLVLELYRWIGSAIEPFLEALKPVQVKELKDQFSKMIREDKVPKRFLRSQKKSSASAFSIPLEAQNMGASTEIMEKSASKPLDAYELAEPENILDKMPSQFDEMISSPKWSERKEALDSLNNLLSVPKLADGYYGSLMQSLIKVIHSHLCYI